MRILFTMLILIITTLSNVTAYAGAKERLRVILEAKSETLIQEAVAATGDDSRAAFKHFVSGVMEELDKSGYPETAKRLNSSLESQVGYSALTDDLAWLVHTFARGYYQDEIIQATSDLIKFRTYATDVPNRQNPEFIKQKEYLQQLCEKLGLQFRDADGYVQEIWIGQGPGTFGLMVHSDVQPVDRDAWQVDPWAGIVRDGKLWGRGAMDDKGPLAVIMYGMRALLDTGLPLQKKLILLVGTDEESANEDVTTYLKSNPAPDQTVVVDYSYPVICAEKGWCGLWLRLPRQHSAGDAQGLIVEDLQSGFSPAIVPGKATAVLRVVGRSARDAEAELKQQITRFHEACQNSKLKLTRENDRFTLTAHGKAVHSSLPEEGHNALIDLLVFLHDYINPAENELALMTRFAATYIGFELNGEKLGIAHHDDFMGDVTVAANLFETTKDTVMFMFNFRVPKGITQPELQQALAARIDSFSQVHDIEFAQRSYYSEAHYTDPQSPFVQKLLSIYNTVTGEEASPESTGGGTYARRLPNAVVFGPKMPDESYLGHQPNEYFSLTTLVHNIEILTYTLTKFGLESENLATGQ